MPDVFGGSSGGARGNIQRSAAGLVVSFACPHCEAELQSMLRWHEVRRMLEGHHVTDVTPHGDYDGWTVVGYCTGTDCGQLWSYSLSADELESQAKKEVKRRQRAGG